MRSKKIFDQRQPEIVSCIERVESKTSAEIVCATADESGRYDRAESIIGFVFALVLFVCIQTIQVWSAAPGDWSTPGLSLSWQIPILVIGFIAGMVIASYWHGLRRFATSETEKITETNRAACVVFSKASIGSSGSRCGLLFYLSHFEKRVVVMPDKAVQDVLGDERIVQLSQLAISEIKSGRICSVFETLIGEVEDELAEKLPANRNLNANELVNHLLFAHRF